MGKFSRSLYVGSNTEYLSFSPTRLLITHTHTHTHPCSRVVDDESTKLKKKRHETGTLSLTLASHHRPYLLEEKEGRFVECEDMEVVLESENVGSHTSKIVRHSFSRLTREDMTRPDTGTM